MTSVRQQSIVAIARKGNFERKRFTMTTSLQQITDTFGNWVANGNPPSGGMVYSASTDFSRLPGYAQYGVTPVTVSAPDFAYGAVQMPATTSITSAATTFNNDTEAVQGYSISLSETTTQAFQWSTTQALSVNVTVSAKVTIPAVAEVGGSVSTDMSFSTTNGATSSTSKIWTITDELSVPPNSTLSTNEVVTCQSYNAPWTATCLLTGWVAVWYNNRWAAKPNAGDHMLWFYLIENVLAAVQQEALIDTTGYTVVGNGVIATASGTFTGGHGINSALTTIQTPYPPTASAKPLISSLPISSDGRFVIVGADPATPLNAKA
jgi:hypothetical protein